MRLRLFLSLALVSLISVVGVVVIASRSTTTAVRAYMYRGGMIGAGGLVQELENFYLANGSWDGVSEILKSSGNNRGQGMMRGVGGMMNQRLRLADAEGMLIADTATVNPTGALTRTERKDAIEIQADGRTVGYLLAEGGIGSNQREESFLVDRLTRAGIMAGLIAGGISLLLSILLAYSLIRPVRELTGAARRLGEGDLSQRVRIDGGDELAVLAQAFNRMADSLQKVEASRRSMTADIAHELRNPLAVQRANLEALQDGVYPLEPEALDPILDQNLLLTRLVDDLRTLALADAGELKLERTVVDYVGLVERSAERFRPQLDLQKVELKVERQSTSSRTLIVLADPMRIEQILNNLISNALRYTPEGGRITLQIAAEKDTVATSVLDSGPGISVEALPHIFERFYRADRARSRSGGGSGLGLAIARNLAEVHGGTLTAANHPQGGAVFTLRLPLVKT